MKNDQEKGLKKGDVLSKIHLSKVLILLIAFSLTYFSIPFSAIADEGEFKDVKKDDTFYGEIQYLLDLGKIDGYEDGTFRTNEKITRGQAAKILSEMLEFNYDPTKVTGINDVKPEKWYYKGVHSLLQRNILSGYEDGTFKPDRLLTRAEAAKLISLAFSLEFKSTKEVEFKDLHKESWVYPYVQGLVQNEVTKGKTAQHFSPATTITRGEFTALVARAERNKALLIDDVKDGEVLIEGKEYTFDSSLNGIFNSSNYEALQDAKVRVVADGNHILKVNSLEIIANGTADKPIILDGDDSTVNGSLIVNGDYLQVKNLTIKGDLTIGEGVKNSFATEKVIVEGTTTVDEGKTVGTAAVEDVEKSRISIVFKDSSILVLEISRKVEVTATGKTIITTFSLNSDTDIFADEDIIFPKITIQDGVTHVGINVTVKDMLIESNTDVVLTGRGNVENIVVDTNKTVDLQTTGQIGNLTINNPDSSMTIGQNVVLKNLSLPEGVSPEGVVSNYEEVKSDIEAIGGEKNSEYIPPYTGGGDSGTTTPTPTTPPTSGEEEPVNPPGSGGGTEPAPTEYFDAGVLRGNSLGYAKLTIFNQSPNTQVYYQIAKHGATPGTVGEQVPNDAVLYNNTEFLLWDNRIVIIYQVDSNNRILDAVESGRLMFWMMPFEINEDYSQKKITIKTNVDPGEGANVSDAITFISFYYGNEFYKFNKDDLLNVTWENSELPTIVLDMPEGMEQSTNYNTSIEFFGNSTYSFGYISNPDIYEQTMITLLKNVAKEDVSLFRNRLNDFTKVDNVSILKYGDTYENAYRQAVINEESTLLAQQDFINLVKKVNETLSASSGQ